MNSPLPSDSGPFESGRNDRAVESRCLDDSAVQPHHVTGMGKDAAWPGIPEARRNVMRANRGKNTKPEMLLRQMLHALGYRYRLHRRDLPGTPDLVFPSRRKAIQVHGCYWHGHDGCRRANVPKTRTEYWGRKIQANRDRDRRNDATLARMGWEVFTVWECELSDMEAVESCVMSFLGPPRS